MGWSAALDGEPRVAGWGAWRGRQQQLAHDVAALVGQAREWKIFLKERELDETQREIMLVGPIARRSRKLRPDRRTPAHEHYGFFFNKALRFLS